MVFYFYTVHSRRRKVKRKNFSDDFPLTRDVLSQQRSAGAVRRGEMGRSGDGGRSGEVGRSDEVGSSGEVRLL